MIVELSACSFHVTNGERRNEHNGGQITNVHKTSAEKRGRITGASMGGFKSIGNNLTDFSFPQKLPSQAWILCLNYSTSRYFHKNILKQELLIKSKNESL